MLSTFFPHSDANLLSPSCLFVFFFRDIDKIDDLMQDITEQQDTAREISEAISRPFGETFDEVDTFSTSCQNLFIHSFLSIILHSANKNALCIIEILSTLCVFLG